VRRAAPRRLEDEIGLAKTLAQTNRWGQLRGDGDGGLLESREEHRPG
jgi:hypothetical protein